MSEKKQDQLISNEMAPTVLVISPNNYRFIRSMVIVKLKPFTLMTASIRPPAIIGAAIHRAPS